MQLIRKLKQHDIIPLWSNLPFYIPAGLALQKGLVWYGVLIALATTVSLYYHHTDETALKKTDRVLAYSVIIANLYVLHLSGWKQPYFAVALFFVVIAFYFFLMAVEPNTTSITASGTSVRWLSPLCAFWPTSASLQPPQTPALNQLTLILARTQ